MQLAKAMGAVFRYLRRQRSAYMEPLGLRGPHIRYLLDVAAEPGISQDKLAQRIAVDKSNIARHVAMLEEFGYLRREPGKTDKRVLCLYPTEKTLATLPELESAMEQWEQTLLQDLTPQEAEQFAALLARVCQRAMKEDPDGKIG